MSKHTRFFFFFFDMGSDTWQWNLQMCGIIKGGLWMPLPRSQGSRRLSRESRRLVLPTGVSKLSHTLSRQDSNCTTESKWRYLMKYLTENERKHHAKFTRVLLRETQSWSSFLYKYFVRTGVQAALITTHSCHSFRTLTHKWDLLCLHHPPSSVSSSNGQILRNIFRDYRPDIQCEMWRAEIVTDKKLPCALGSDYLEAGTAAGC